MNTSALWIIILIIWIFTLQSRIKKLENLLRAKQEKTKDKKIESMPSPSVEIQKEKKPIPLPLPKNTIPEIEEPSKIVTFIKDYFTGGNLLVRVGSVILFIGLAFLVKYASEHSVISLQMRLWSVALVAMVLIVLGWRLRAREGAYGQILQGLGIAILYLLIYATSKFYALLSLDMAFILMIMVVILGLMGLSKRYENRPLWLVGFGLLLIVVLKLFFVELAHSGSLERIVSFLVVGSLLLVIGYFVPVPPKKEEIDNTSIRD